MVSSPNEGMVTTETSAPVPFSRDCNLPSSDCASEALKTWAKSLTKPVGLPGLVYACATGRTSQPVATNAIAKRALREKRLLEVDLGGIFRAGLGLEVID